MAAAVRLAHSFLKSTGISELGGKRNTNCFCISMRCISRDKVAALCGEGIRGVMGVGCACGNDPVPVDGEEVD